MHACSKQKNKLTSKKDARWMGGAFVGKETRGASIV